MERHIIIRGGAAEKQTETLKILYTNAQSLLSKLNELSVITSVLKPDVVMIAETWTNGGISNAALNMPGYRIEARSDRQDTNNGIGGGLIIYVKECYEILSVSLIESNFNQHCSIGLKTKTGQLNLFLIYRSPNSNTDNLNLLCDLLMATKQNSILVGDFNLPGINWEEGRATGQAKRLLEASEEAGLTQLVDFSTHRKGNLLDLILTNCPEKFIQIKEEGCLGNSDHCIIMAEIEIGIYKQEKKPRVIWDRGNYEQIRTEFNMVNWTNEINGRDLETAWQFLKNKLTDLVERHVPKKIMKGAAKPRWLSREIVRIIRKKKHCWKIFKNEGGAENKKRYEEAAKTAKKAIARAKKHVEKCIAYSKDDNNKQFNSYIKSKTKSRAPIGPIKLTNGGLAVEDKDMAAELNRFFASVFTKEDLTNVPVKQRETNATLNTVTITEGKIREKIRNLKHDSAAGPDNIHPRLLKELENEILIPLKLIYERSLNENVIPLDWKIATVTPIFKKGSRTDPGNYRPVSLTSVPCKMLESIIKDELNKHMEGNGLINESQHGFMKGRSCVTNIVEFMEVVTKATDAGQAVDIFYLDFSKAFDKVPKERLMVKIRAKGVEGKLADWLHNWLTDRKQAVKIGGARSEEEKVESGVMQGTVLGPCLFTIHIDDIDEVVRRIEFFIKFADDGKGAKIIKNATDAVALQDTLDMLCRWAEKWGMSFNEKKCKVMHIGKNNPNFDYYMNGVRLAVVEEEKDVGITVQRNLKPAKHCQRVAATAMGVLKQMTRTFHYRDRNIFLRLYKQYVRPHVEFATPAWSPWLISDIQTVEKVQEKAVGMISGLKGRNYEEKCKELEIETLQERREINDMAQVFKLISGKDKISRVTLFNHVPPGRTRMAADPLNVRPEIAKTEIRKNFFSQRIAAKWNKIPSTIKNSRNVHQFKASYRRFTNQSGVDGEP
jgi:hypothetical protein